MPVNRKMMKAMKEQYGPEKGERIYYAKESERFGKEQKMKKKMGYMGGGMAAKDKMGYMGGGMTKKPMNEGMKALKKEAPEVAKKMGYAGGGSVVKANCGASMKPNRMAKK